MAIFSDAIAAIFVYRASINGRIASSTSTTMRCPAHAPFLEAFLNLPLGWTLPRLIALRFVQD